MGRVITGTLHSPVESSVTLGHKTFVSAKNRRIFLDMASGQQLLFAPEKPLVKRLGKRFFHKIPQHAGVYKMRDAADKIVYVGKAKNLRQRLQSYRVANPERLGRRHLKLLQSVASIEFELCRNESAALKQEAKLIRELRPRFNRAGVWPGRPQFLVWRFFEEALEVGVQETPLTGWERLGSLGAYAPRLRTVLARLLWRAMNTSAVCQHMPHGWLQNKLPAVARIRCGGRTAEVQAALTQAFWGEPVVFLNWLAMALNTDRTAFERAVIAKDLTELQGFFEQQPQRAEKQSGQMALL